MRGYLRKNHMNNLIAKGFSLEKFYEECEYDEYNYVEIVTRELTNEERQEYIDEGEMDFLSDRVIVSEKYI